MAHRRLALAAALATSMYSTVAWGTGGPSPGAVTAEKVKVPDGPGSIRGLGSEIEISAQSGQIGYGISIDVPAGVGGLAPKLSLGYDGALGNGILGIGWHLGHAQITRSLRHGVPRYDDADELEISGVGAGRLIRLADGTYRVEGAGNGLKVERAGNRWVVIDTDGTRYNFGATGEARQEEVRDGEVRTAVWYLQWVETLTGEIILYRYDHDRGAVYLREIVWGPGDRYRVALGYEQRPDAVTSWRTGASVELRRRLSSMTVYSSNTVLRTYTVGYDDGRPSSRVASIAMTGVAGSGSIPSPRFTYGPRSPGQVMPLEDTAGWALEQRGVTLLDVDGDGMDDLVSFEMGNPRWKHNLGGRFAPAAPLPGASSAELGSISLLDVDGDARADLVRIADDTWRIYALDWNDGAPQWQPRGVWPGTQGVPLWGPAMALADVNGDGLTDVLEAVTGGVRARIATRTGLGVPRTMGHISAVDPSVELGAPGVRLTDFNGDGLVDVVWLHDAWMKLYLGRGDGTFVAWRKLLYPWGDGGFEPEDVHLADLDRDGIMDLVRVTIGHVLWVPGLPSGGWGTPRALARPAGTDTDVIVQLADANGNGSIDVVWSTPGGMWLVDLAGTTTAGMLTSIAGGLGATTTIEYAPSAQLSVEALQTGAPWTHRLPVSIPVPVRVERDPGGGDPVVAMHHGVSDGVYDGVERRFAGFSTLTSVAAGADAGDTRVSEVRYHAGLGADRVLRGAVLSTEVRDGLGRIQSRSESDRLAYDIGLRSASGRPEDDALLRVAVTTAERRYVHDGQATPIELATTYGHDAQGRVIYTHEHGRTDRTGDEEYTTVQFATDDETTWLRDRVCETASYDGDGRLAGRARTYYGDATTVESLCVVGTTGWVRRTEGYLAEESRWIELSAMTYDARGNVTTATAGGVTRTHGYDASGLFLESESVSPASGETLTWQATWDQTRGVLTRVTDPAGAAVDVGYDALLRPSTMGYAGRPAHIHYQYELTASRPITTTFVFDGPDADLGPLPGTWTPTSGWRQRVTVHGGGKQPLYSATRLDTATWIVSGRRQLDGRGRVATQWEAFYASGSDVRALDTAMPPDTRYQTFEHDAFDRLVAVHLATGVSRRTSYAPLEVTAEVDGLAPVRTFHDGLGRLIANERGTERLEVFYEAGRIGSYRVRGGSEDVTAWAEHVFTYDSLGRLTHADDPDIGPRDYVYDDAGRLIEATNGAGQWVDFAYDGAGRLLTQVADDGTTFTYHYDTPRPGSSMAFTQGRLAWVEEPTGYAEVGYDAFGRTVATAREIDGTRITESRTLSPAGSLLEVGFDHEVTIGYQVDPAGRVVKVGNLWEVLDYDAAGRIRQERSGNGVIQYHDYDPDIGDVSGVRIEQPGGASLYDIALTRTPWRGIDTVTDQDGGAGIDHTADFDYDDRMRLTRAVLGTGAGQHVFDYTYSDLQNMLTRTVSNPGAVDVLAGTYVYGEAGQGPRQLSRVVDTSAATIASFAYDAAGRVTSHGDKALTYSGLDQLTRIEGLPDALGGTTGAVEHAYGYDGMRIETTAVDGGVTHFFTEAITQRGDLRTHRVTAGSRTIAEIHKRYTGSSAAGSTETAAAVQRIMTGIMAALGALTAAALLAALAALLWALVWPAPRRRRLAHALSVILSAALALPPAGCSVLGFSSQSASLWETEQTIYVHHGVAAGPVLLTREDASVLEERRYEPFGADLDAFRTAPGGTTPSFGEIDFELFDLNSLNKRSDSDTKWSYHGARWLAPETARWLTPDPPVKGPDDKYLAEPWALHPYQYVLQNPIAFWDPDGREERSVFDLLVNRGNDDEWDEGSGDTTGNSMVPPDVAALQNELDELPNKVAATVAVASSQAGYHIDENKEVYALNGASLVLGAAAPRALLYLLLGTAANENEIVLPMLFGALSRSRPMPAHRPPRGTTGAAARGATGICFAAGTLVHTERGLVPIEEIRRGDRVWSQDDETGEEGYRRVAQTFVTPDQPTLELELVGNGHTMEVLEVTGEHPFWVSGRGWVAAQELQPGDEVYTSRGGWLRVSGGTWMDRTTTVYNFEVEDFHTYFVGEVGVWVHNNCGARLDPTKVRFSQSSIKARMRNGSSIDDLAEGLRTGRINPDDVPPIRVVERNGNLHTLDNRRLEAFRRAGVEIPHRMATAEEAAAEAWKFTTRNGGKSIRVRGE